MTIAFDQGVSVFPLSYRYTAYASEGNDILIGFDHASTGLTEIPISSIVEIGNQLVDETPAHAPLPTIEPREADGSSPLILTHETAYAVEVVFSGVTNIFCFHYRSTVYDLYKKALFLVFRNESFQEFMLTAASISNIGFVIPMGRLSCETTEEGS